MRAARCCCVRVLYFSTNIVFMSGVDMTRNHGSEQERQYLVHSVLCDIEVTLTQLESGSRGNTKEYWDSSKGNYDFHYLVSCILS